MNEESRTRLQNLADEGSAQIFMNSTLSISVVDAESQHTSCLEMDIWSMEIVGLIYFIALGNLHGQVDWLGLFFGHLWVARYQSKDSL